jgi:hypothetical protein
LGECVHTNLCARADMMCSQCVINRPTQHAAFAHLSAQCAATRRQKSSGMLIRPCVARAAGATGQQTDAASLCMRVAYVTVACGGCCCC